VTNGTPEFFHRVIGDVIAGMHGMGLGSTGHERIFDPEVAGDAAIGAVESRGTNLVNPGGWFQAGFFLLGASFECQLPVFFLVLFPVRREGFPHPGRNQQKDEDRS
jgi:hypothetical protein